MSTIQPISDPTGTGIGYFGPNATSGAQIAGWQRRIWASWAINRGESTSRSDRSLKSGSFLMSLPGSVESPVTVLCDAFKGQALAAASECGSWYTVKAALIAVPGYLKRTLWTIAITSAAFCDRGGGHNAQARSHINCTCKLNSRPASGSRRCHRNYLGRKLQRDRGRSPTSHMRQFQASYRL